MEQATQQIKTIEQKAATIVKDIQKTKTRSRSISRSISKTKSITKTKQLQKQKSLQKQKQDNLQKQLQRQKQRLKLRTKQVQRLKLLRLGKIKPTVKAPPKGIKLLIPPKLKKKKIKKVVVRKKGKGSFDVFAKPVKGKRLVKVNKKPLSKTDARNLRNFVIDTSLSRTGSIKSTRGEISKPAIKVPIGFAKRTAKKFRSYRKRKGKRIPLKKGKVIEKKTSLLDTRQERKKITLRARLRQLSPKKKVKKKKIVKKQLSPQQRQILLNNLARARAIKKVRNGNGAKRSRQITKAKRTISII